MNDVLGRAYGFQGRSPEAERECRAMRAQYPERPETLMDVGCALYAEK